MKQNIRVKPEKDKLLYILQDIRKGDINIPEFQRDVVWTEKQMLKLLDSIKKGYSLGSLLFWKPEIDFECKKTFGPYIIPSKAEKKYVLDGYQRLSTLFGVLSSPIDFNKEYTYNSIGEHAIFYDLENDDFEYHKRGQSIPELYVPVYLLADTFATLSYLDRLRTLITDENLQQKYINKVKNLAKSFVDYEIPYVDIIGGDIEDAVEIFSRVNSTGTSLSKDWMISALSYQKGEFLLSREIDDYLITLEKYNFSDLDRNVILNCIAATTGKYFSDVKLEELLKENSFDFPQVVSKSFTTITKAIEFLFKELNVIDYKLLPYSNQLVYLSEFFRIAQNPKSLFPKLKEWFWVTSYSNYFTIYNSLSKQRKALIQFKNFALGRINTPVYVDTDQNFITNPFPEKVNFGSVRSKSLLLFMLNKSAQNTEIINRPLDVRYLTRRERITSGVLINDYNIFEKHNGIKSNSQDASFILDENLNENQMTNWFLSNELIDVYKNDNINDFLEFRRLLIQQEEKIFVENLKIIYTEEKE